MLIFIEPSFIRDIDYLECTVEFTIKGDNSINDTKIQYLWIFNVNYLQRTDILE